LVVAILSVLLVVSVYLLVIVDSVLTTLVNVQFVGGESVYVGVHCSSVFEESSSSTLTIGCLSVAFGSMGVSVETSSWRFLVPGLKKCPFVYMVLAYAIMRISNSSHLDCEICTWRSVRFQSSVNVCVLLLQDLLQSCSRGGGRRVEDMCYERRRA
jgi:hypothetical protein